MLASQFKADFSNCMRKPKKKHTQFSLIGTLAGKRPVSWMATRHLLDSNLVPGKRMSAMLTSTDL
ncbi:hypothetical protein BURPS1106A_0619 [Burkholderia pseudomallei 1106a]|uniref:Uncharacterized protein n=1 Tax=Burkholderia pseudomallei (strain 1106a) TaxID=357348 RepID=A3NRD0_BURP0|nr:hypothetical protein BURPS1106A_0619 [Burkholderia pseudomallei 1106a]